MKVYGKKEYTREECKKCIYAEFKVAQGLHPDYGWWIQICNYPDKYRCVPTEQYQQLEIWK